MKTHKIKKKKCKDKSIVQHFKQVKAVYKKTSMDFVYYAIHGMCQSKHYKQLVRIPSNYGNFQMLLMYAVYYLKKNTSTVTTIQEFHTL